MKEEKNYKNRERKKSKKEWKAKTQNSLQFTILYQYTKSKFLFPLELCLFDRPLPILKSHLNDIPMP